MEYEIVQEACGKGDPKQGHYGVQVISVLPGSVINELINRIQGLIQPEGVT